MGVRSYRQYCAIAQALDRVGERWTLLIVRQLFTGPKRFKDLQDDLPGIGTNLLAARLKQLERDGVVERGTLPPPAASNVYQLTKLGHELEPVLAGLAKWGQRFLGPPKKGLSFRPGWAIIAMRGTFKPEAAKGVFEAYEYRIDGEVFHVRVEDGKTEIQQGPGWKPHLVLTTDTQTFLALGTGQVDPKKAIVSGKAHIQGSLETLQRSIEIFGVRFSSRN